MGEDLERSGRRTVIGGRHGSPSLTIAWPFSNIVSVDGEMRDAVGELAALVARLAEHAATGDATEIELVREAAEELALRMSRPTGG